MNLKQLINESIRNYHLPEKKGCACGCNTCHLEPNKKLKESIKEHIRQIFNEETDSTIIKLKGILITDTKVRTQEDILSDIRSINGVTIISTKPAEGSFTKERGRKRSSLSVKVDPHPFIGKGGFGKAQLESIYNEIKKITGVLSFKLTEKPRKL